jgi:ATP synthase protein I
LREAKMSGNEGGREPVSGDPSFEARLRQARTKAGLDAPAPNAASDRDSGMPSALGIGLRVGIELVSALVVGLGIGWLLDHWLHTTPVFLAIFVLLGGAAGVMNVYRVMGPNTDKPR